MSVVQEKGVALPHFTLPGEGDTVKLGLSGPSIKLGKQLGAGGEGQVYELIGDGRVAKIYHADQLSANRIAKLELMASREVSRRGICWPERLVYASNGAAVGYVMQRAHGHPLHNCVEFDGVRQCVEAMAEWINDTAGDWEPSEAQQGLTPIPDGYNEG